MSHLKGKGARETRGKPPGDSLPLSSRARRPDRQTPQYGLCDHPTGDIVGKHRKINVIPISEAWSTSGEPAAPIPVPPVRVGVLICADAYSMRPSQSLKAQEAELLVSAAAWAPGEHGPNGEWEQCTRETGLPLLVCNRTGKDRSLDFTGAISGVFQDGERLLSFQSERSMIFLIDWDCRTQSLAFTEFNTIEL